MNAYSQPLDLTCALVDVSRALIAKSADKVAFDVSLFEDRDRFTTWAPFDVLSKGGDARLGYIQGIASTEAPDADGDIILTKGIDWSYFIGDGISKGKGFIIDEHPVGTHNVVGHPLSVSDTQVEYNGAKVNAALVKGALYLEDKRGAAIFEKACTMRRAGGDRRLGFSIEGSVKPGGRKGRVVEKSMVKWLAITAAPKNELSWWEPVAKSIMAAAGVQAGDQTRIEQHTTQVIAHIMGTLSTPQTADQLAEALALRICKAHPDMTWRESTTVLKRVLESVTQSPS
jgi:hypothetical protein